MWGNTEVTDSSFRIGTERTCIYEYRATSRVVGYSSLEAKGRFALYASKQPSRELVF